MNILPIAAVVTAASLLFTFPATAATIHVPVEQPTIQAGINAASAGDTVLVACGTYYEHDIVMKSGVYLTSETGLADCVTIDAQEGGRVLYCDGVDGLAGIVGFTIAGGHVIGDERGGGVYCYQSSPTLTNCTFSGNDAESAGGMYCNQSSPTLTNCRLSGNSAYAGNAGGLMCTGESSPTVTDCEFSGNGAFGAGAVGLYSSSPTFTECVFTGNSSANIGGAMDCYSSSPTLTRCTFLDNHAATGGAVACWDTGAPPEFIGCTFSGNGHQQGADGTAVYSSYGASPTLTECIIVFGTSGPVVSCDSGGTVALTCCDIYGNAGGDWVGCIADQYGVDGNFSEDPLFCGGLNPDEPYTLHASSPCAPENNPECGLIGAWGVGCGLTPVQTTSWGAVKALYR